MMLLLRRTRMTFACCGNGLAVANFDAIPRFALHKSVEC